MIFLAINALLGLLLPQALPIVLLAGTVGDWMMPAFGLNVYSNEWALAGAALGLALRAATGKALPPRPTWLILVFAPLAAVILLHGAWPGPAGVALKDLLRAGQFWLGLFLPLWLLSGWSLKLTRGFALVFVLAAVAWGLAQSLAGPGAPLNSGHEAEVFYGLHQSASSFFQHHNQFGAFLDAAIPFALAMGGPGLLMLALGPWALYASYSRGAWVALLLASAWLLPAFGFRRFMKWASAFVLLLLFAAALVPAMRERLQSIAGKGANNDRMTLTQVGLQLWQGAPLWGRGPGAVKRELPPALDALTLRPQDKAMFLSHLHDQWMQWGVEYGAAGVLAWAFFFGCLLWRAAGVARGTQGRRRAWALALAVAVSAFCLQSFSDLLMLHARGLDIAILWGLCLAGMDE